MAEITLTIIGANSFLARNFIASIFNDQYKLFLYDKDESHLDNYCNYQKIDLASKESINKINFDSDLIYFFSGRTGTIQGFKSYKSFIEINEVYLLNFLTVYCEKKAQAKIIYPSTRLIYQEKNRKAIKESDEVKLRSVYAVTKYASESYLKIYSEVFGVNYCILRICVPYGSLLNDIGSYGTYEIFMEQAKKKKEITVFGDGKIYKTYTDITDICKVLLMSGLSENCMNDTFNVGGDNKSLLEIATIIGEKYNVPIKHVPWSGLNKKIDAGNTILDSQKLDQILKIQYKKIE